MNQRGADSKDVIDSKNTEGNRTPSSANMIVVDTNIIAYLFLPSEATETAERLLELDYTGSSFGAVRCALPFTRKQLLSLAEAIEIKRKLSNCS